MGEQQRQFESVRRNFTEQEMTTMGDGLVESVGTVRTLRAEKTAAVASMNGQIKTTEKIVFELQEKLSLGYELVDVETITVLDEPEPGKKKIIRADTSEVLRVEVMTMRERQQSFGFQEPE